MAEVDKWASSFVSAVCIILTKRAAISMALVSSHTIPMLLDLMKAGKLDTSKMITHGEF